MKISASKIQQSKGLIMDTSKPGKQYYEESATIDEKVYQELNNRTADSETTDYENNVSDAEKIKANKFKTLYQCRYILSKYGTMQERQICGRQLKQMVKKK